MHYCLHKKSTWYKWDKCWHIWLVYSSTQSWKIACSDKTQPRETFHNFEYPWTTLGYSKSGHLKFLQMLETMKAVLLAVLVSLSPRVQNNPWPRSIRDILPVRFHPPFVVSQKIPCRMKNDFYIHSYFLQRDSYLQLCFDRFVFLYFWAIRHKVTSHLVVVVG